MQIPPNPPMESRSGSNPSGDPWKGLRTLMPILDEEVNGLSIFQKDKDIEKVIQTIQKAIDDAGHIKFVDATPFINDLINLKSHYEVLLGELKKFSGPDRAFLIHDAAEGIHNQLLKVHDSFHRVFTYIPITPIEGDLL